jgi:NAD(P)-dependent dehydrogenase (short-subunit alcohol dehydrogenase family)
MDLGLDQRVVVVTGGSSGIGKACAREFAKEGCRVAICGRDSQRLIAAVDEFRREGVEVFSGVADATNSDQLKTFAASVAAYYGGIDVWINNAGKAAVQYLIEIGEDEFDEMFRQNVTSVFAGSRVAAEYMKMGRGGVIVNASSFAALMPASGRGHMQQRRPQSLASRAASRRSSGLTAFACWLMLPEATALNRIGNPEEIAKTIVLLASDAASYMTGTTIDISGGKFCVQNPAAEYGRCK